MAFFALIYNSDGAPIDDGDIRALTRAFKYHKGKLAQHQISRSFVILVSYTEEYETTPHLVQMNDAGLLALIRESRTPKISPLDAMADYPAFALLPTPFAAIAWSQKKLRLISDPTGGRAVFYSQQGRSIIAASEPRLVLSHPAVSGEPDMGVVAEQICFSRMSPTQTIYRQIKLLAAGSMLECNKSSTSIEPWHRFDLSVNKTKSSEEWQADILSVSKQVMADLLEDIPNEQMSLALSGGLDSSALAGLMAVMGKDDQATAVMNRYPGLPCDESSFQDAVLTDCRFTPKIFNHRAFDPESDLLQQIERSQLPIHKVEPEATDGFQWSVRNGIQYRLGGGGGDELFAFFGMSPLDALCTGSASEVSGALLHRPRWVSESREHAPRWVRKMWRKRRLPSQIKPQFANEVDLHTRMEQPSRMPGVRSLACRREQWFLDSGGYAITHELQEFQAADQNIQFITPFWGPAFVGVVFEDTRTTAKNFSRSSLSTTKSI